MPSRRTVLRKLHSLFSNVFESLSKSACVFSSAQCLYHLAAPHKNLRSSCDSIVLLEITSFSNVHKQEKVTILTDN